KTINYVNGTPSGTTSIIDLTDVGGISVRTSNMRARVISSTLEPPRSCLLFPYRNNLHAFVISATSGYHYLRCDGAPQNINNWSLQTSGLPLDFRYFDGD